MRRPAAKQMPVAVLGHPASASEVCLPGAPGALGLVIRIEVEHDPRDLGPVGAVLFGVEQAEISDQVLLVIAGQDRRGRRVIGDIRIERRLLHGAYSLARFLPAESRRVLALVSRPELRTTWCLTGITEHIAAAASESWPKVIVLAWVNGDTTLRAVESASDAYATTLTLGALWGLPQKVRSRPKTRPWGAA